VTALFITATGTDIGKTFVAAALIRQLRAQGRAVAALKPVVTGFDPAKAEDSDPGVLLRALGRPPDLAEIEQISPWRYPDPLSPDMAARHAGRPLAFAELTAFCREAVARRRDVLLIEGIGGVMVPLDEKHTVLDLMQALRLPVLLVAGSYLGTLSHTLTAFAALTSRDLTVHAIIVNETPSATVPLADTIESITHFVQPVPVIGLSRGAADTHVLERIAAACIDP
jgi:dethiobiotin synthetase